MSEVKVHLAGYLAEGEHVVLQPDYDSLKFDFDRVTAERDGLRNEVGQVKGEYDRAVNKVDALQALLTAADERSDMLERLVRDVQAAFNYNPEGSCYNPGIKFVKPWSERAIAALKPAEVKLCKTCNGTGIVSDGAMYCSSGGIPFECGPIECVKDCPECTKP